MKAHVVAFVAGLVFAIGLCIGGMTLPSKIVGFLDFAGQWDASLAFVMGGGVVVYAVAFRLVRGRKSPLFSPTFVIPTHSDIDSRLVAGSALFGVGWGLGGFCPGPAITAIAWTAAPVIIFVVAMCAGMYLHSLIGAVSTARLSQATAPVAADA